MSLFFLLRSVAFHLRRLPFDTLHKTPSVSRCVKGVNEGVVLDGIITRLFCEIGKEKVDIR